MNSPMKSVLRAELRIADVRVEKLGLFANARWRNRRTGRIARVGYVGVIGPRGDVALSGGARVSYRYESAKLNSHVATVTIDEERFLFSFERVDGAS